MGGQTITIDGKWDLIIAHPPCTYLAVSGNSWFNEEKYGDAARARKEKRLKAFDFFMEFINADCKKIAVENPVGYVNSHYRKPDQIIQPYEYGHPYTKKTCLWLKGLPRLTPTNILTKPANGWENQYFSKDGRYSGYGDTWGATKGAHWNLNDPELKKQRSRTFWGIARAMAEQWGGD